MKYGRSLVQRSVPAWKIRMPISRIFPLRVASNSAIDNLDYNDIKRVIKAATQGDGSDAALVLVKDVESAILQDLEDLVFNILLEQHDRIHLFVKCKFGEIKHRLGHIIDRLRSRRCRTSDANIKQANPFAATHWLAVLAADTQKAGGELRSLTRFVSAQRTGFQKLLKKYERWTKSDQLRLRFCQALKVHSVGSVLPGTEPLIHVYAIADRKLHSLLQTSATVRRPRRPRDFTPALEVTHDATAFWQTAIDNGATLDFESQTPESPEIEPVDQSLMVFSVSPHNLAELQLLLLTYFLDDSKSCSPRSQAQKGNPSNDVFCEAFKSRPNYFELSIDSYRLSKTTPHQYTDLFTTWHASQTPQITLCSADGRSRNFVIKDRYFGPLLGNRMVAGSEAPHGEFRIGAIKGFCKETGEKIKLYPFQILSSNRWALSGINNNRHNNACFATLDSNITVRGRKSEDSGTTFGFPRCTLTIRQFGSPHKGLMKALERSQLVQRMHCRDEYG